MLELWDFERHPFSSPALILIAFDFAILESFLCQPSPLSRIWYLFLAVHLVPRMRILMDAFAAPTIRTLALALARFTSVIWLLMLTFPHPWGRLFSMSIVPSPALAFSLSFVDPIPFQIALSRVASLPPCVVPFLYI